MENKEIRNLLVENIKKELVDFAQIQKDLKKSRKLEFRPKDKSLQSIVDEIDSNRDKISILFFYYRWLKHGLKYWIRHNVDDYWDYHCKYYPGAKFASICRNQNPWWNKDITYEQYIKGKFKKYTLDIIQKNHIELYAGKIDEFVEYIYKNKK